MSDRTPYDDMLAILEPVYLAIRDDLAELNWRKQWDKERKAHLSDNGWTDEEFTAAIMGRRKQRAAAADAATSSGARAGAPLTRPPVRKEPPKPAQQVSQIPPQIGSAQVEAWHNLSQHKGSPVTYTSRNRRHTFRWGQGYECTVTCFDARTGKQYWSCAVGVGPNTRVVDAVRAARLGAGHRKD